jgi:hypothetical protein|nr:MAG TPA: putative NAD-reducing hydrogenase subunit [Caudoviricetes sp.]
MPEVEIRAVGHNKEGERTFDVTVNNKTYHSITFDKAMSILRESEEDKK